MKSNLSMIDQASTEASRVITEVSVILPVYNEQTCIEKTFDAVLEYSRSHPTYHFLFVNDGSSDWTKPFLQSKINAAGRKEIQLLSYDFHAGKGYAIKRGLVHTYGDYVCYVDSDLAYSLDHLELLIVELQQFDIVIGCRRRVGEKRLSFSRRIAGRVFNLLSRGLLDLPYRDMQAGLKGFRRHSAKALFLKQTMNGFSFDVELIYIARKFGYSITEIPAIVSNEHQRKRSQVNLLSDSLAMLFDLLTIRFNDRRGKYD
ncbi:glycosyltransferase [Leptolyngbya sp. NIES-2104]|uniref:glycosyltransferase n=1 Tax=Leptolyngbya sp. NIES-2104 TaxID=1552121 RepID=UPI0006ECCD0F|nr:glycosyltransferase [Leptolyngbya sp. NIES-2104]GAP99529.1 dolichyl-phosphate beta-glucosyltransferase [Leptolyngbya sp. NIES-2104]